MASVAGKLAIGKNVTAHRLFSPSCRIKHLPQLSFGSKNLIPSLGSSQVFSRHDCFAVVLKASSTDRVSPAEEGVSLGTMKLPPNVDVARFEILLFQWANSLFQGSNLPLEVPLKVDKVLGGARLGFTVIGSDGQVEVPVYIDCLVFPGTENSNPVFRAIRKGPSKGKPAPGEPRIMTSLLEALKKCVQLATI